MFLKILILQPEAKIHFGLVHNFNTEDTEKQNTTSFWWTYFCRTQRNLRYNHSGQEHVKSLGVNVVSKKTKGKKMQEISIEETLFLF